MVKDKKNQEPHTCGECANRIDEECDFDGHEVWEDTEACDNFVEEDEEE